MSWDKSETNDMLWGARKLVLSVAEGMETLMDVIDPNQCERYGYDRYGEVIERESDTYTTLDFIFMWEGKLRRVNSMLYELTDRLKVMESELEKDKEVDDGGSSADSGA